MSKPTKEQINDTKEALIRSLGIVGRRLPKHDPMLDAEWHKIETFCAFALRVMAKTNPSKLRDELRTVEISGRLAGRPVLNSD